MLLTEKDGDLITEGEEGRVDVIVHQANLQHTFGAGIARQIRLRLPYAFEADLETIKGDEGKLGTFSIGYPPVASKLPFVVNLYSQTSLYPSHTSYDYMYEALVSVRSYFSMILPYQTHEAFRIGFPFQMGSGLADGDWDVVKAIILSVFKDSRFEIVIVKLSETQKPDPLVDLMVDVGVEAFKSL